MTKRIGSSTQRLFAAIILTLAAFGVVFAQESPLPPPTGHVNDYAGVIDAATKQQLEDKLRAFKEKTGVELAVAVVKTTGDRPIFDYSLDVARGWKIGSKADDNPSALLFIAVDDRKYFTQISRDLEDELPDGIAGSLQRQFLVPEFKKGNYAKGISDTIGAYIATIDHRLSGVPAETPAAATTEGGGFPFFSAFCCLVVIGVIVLIIWSNRSGGGGGKSRRDEDRWGGGFGGAAGAIPWIIAGGSGSSSSDSSSSWGSSGGSDWGGFGGGGDFGGGGAGGDW